MVLMTRFLRWLWPFPWPWRPDDISPPTNPVLLIPGICGTQLAVRDRNEDHNAAKPNRVWVCIAHADKEYKKLWGKVNPESHRLELLDRSLEVCVPQAPAADDGGLYSIDILDPSIYVPLHVVYYYHNMIWYFKKHKYEPGRTLFGFGYDFRQSNPSHIDALLARLEDIAAKNGGARVDVVTHSMGGLIMRSFLATRPDDYARLVRKWIALAAPFGGAPGFTMDALLTGVQFAEGWEQYFFVERSTMHTMCSQAPAVHELLPDPKRSGVWEHEPPTVTVVRKKSDDPDGEPLRETFSVADFRSLMRSALKGCHVTTYDNQEVTMEMDETCWEISDATRAAWRESAPLPDGCQFYNAYAQGFETPYSVTYGSALQPMDDYTEILRQPARSFVHCNGDCTVPVCCAKADGLNAEERKGFFATHRGLLELPDVWEQIMEWIEAPDPGAEDDDTDADTPAFPDECMARITSAAARERKRANHARFRRSIAAEAHTRSEHHRKAWCESARTLPQTPAAAAAQAHEDGWYLVSHPAMSPTASGDSTLANPLLDKAKASAGLTAGSRSRA